MKDQTVDTKNWWVLKNLCDSILEHDIKIRRDLKRFGEILIINDQFSKRIVYEGGVAKILSCNYRLVNVEV